ncbi:MAG: pantoate--beta-alanine ligase [Actinobacteria bacterium]|nr:pantoate--beta-alanine ligase [Actinomycetota bacterium]
MSKTPIITKSPIIARSGPALRRTLDPFRRARQTIALVPTMGALHAGHLELVRQARRRARRVVVSIFVNPLQFAATEDLGTYPRDLDGDLALADGCGVAHVFAPTVAEMYPEPLLTTVSVADITARFEGASRPEHFAGVATVVAKLFAIAGPCRAYFGEKDFQQLAMVRRMVADLSMPVEVVGCPIVRDHDGLALSSRNVYLSEAQRAAAPVLHRSLLAAAELAAGEADVHVVRGALADGVAAEREAVLDYADLVDAATLQPATSVVPGTQRLLVAARFGTTRLLDNLAV